MSELKIIPKEQTPALPPMGDVVDFINDHIDELNDFFNFAAAHRAVGLASNQVSINGNRIMGRYFAIKDLDTKEWRMIINPVIDEYIGMKEFKREGCLTWGSDLSVIAERSRAVRVSYYNTAGEKVTGEIYKGFVAQVWQHEINHLNGIIERLEPLSFSLPKQVEPDRNAPCPCCSGKKYKKCCMLLV